MKQYLWMCVSVLVAGSIGSTLRADPIPVVLDALPFASLDVTGAVTTPMESPYAYDVSFTGTVASQVFQMANGEYLYLYQANNAGPSSLKALNVGGFFALQAAGMLTEGEPAGFVAGGIAPAGASYDATLSEPTIAFQYAAWLGNFVPAGSSTTVLYAISPYAPVLGEAYVIDTGVATMPVWTPVPEPATMALLGVGALVVLRRQRRSLPA